MTLSSLTQKKELLTIEPGLYYKVQKNERKTLNASTVGLIVDSYQSQTTGECIYNVVLVQGELLLVPSRSSSDATG
jgi:hypothetical protein